jgi:hypothetical protein
MPRTIGFRPIRCSSIAQSSTVASGCSRCSSSGPAHYEPSPICPRNPLGVRSHRPASESVSPTDPCFLRLTDVDDGGLWSGPKIARWLAKFHGSRLSMITELFAFVPDGLCSTLKEVHRLRWKLDSP